PHAIGQVVGAGEPRAPGPAPPGDARPRAQGAGGGSPPAAALCSGGGCRVAGLGRTAVGRGPWAADRAADRVDRAGLRPRRQAAGAYGRAPQPRRDGPAPVDRVLPPARGASSLCRDEARSWRRVAAIEAIDRAEDFVRLID